MLLTAQEPLVAGLGLGEVGHHQRKEATLGRSIRHGMSWASPARHSNMY